MSSAPELDALAESLTQRAAEQAAELVLQRLDGDQAEPWIGVKEAAVHMGYKPQRVYDLASQGVLTPGRDGSRLRFRRSDLDRYLEGEER